MNWDRIFQRTICYAFHVLIFVVPLAWTSTTSELFEFPKMLVVYGLASIIVATWLGRMVVQRKLIWRRTPFDIPLLLFFLSQLISTIVSIDVHTSVYGYYSRFHGGLLSTVSYILLFYAFVTNIDVSEAKRVLKTLLVVGLVSSLYAIPEHFGLSPSCVILGAGANAECWVQDVVTRVFGTFGQPNWLAAYMISIGFIPLALAIKNKDVKIINWLLFATFFVTLLFTKSRSGVLGLAVGMVVFSVFNLLNANNKKGLIKKLSISYLVLALLFVIYGKGIVLQVDNLFSAFRQAPEQTTEQSTNKPQAGTQLAIGGTESGEIRRIVWSGAVDIWKHYLLFGSGVETFAYAYNSFRPTEHNLVSEWDFLYNRAHNEFLNFAATTGTFGLGAYLALIGYFWVWSTKKIAKKAKNNHLLVAFVSGFSGLAVSNFLGFSTVPVALLFFLFPAFALTISGSIEPYDVEEVEIGPGAMVGLAVIGLALILALAGVRRMYKSDTVYAQGKKNLSAQKLTDAVSMLNEAVKRAPNQPLYKDDLSRAAAKAAVGLYEENDATSAAQLAQIAVGFNTQAIEQNPVQLNFYKTRANILANLSLIDSAYIDEAEVTMNKAIELAPTDAKLWLTLGLVHIQQGQMDEAKEVLEKTVEMKPNYEQARYSLGLVYEDLGLTKEARQQYEYILERIAPNSQSAINALEALE